MYKIFLTRFGSHLYGTNTPTSDTDFKGIFMESLENIVLRKDKNTIHEDMKVSTGQRNTQDDTDCEMIELRRFIKDAIGGQTYALDMLFSTEDMWVAVDPIWREIVANRDKLLCRNMKSFLGYIAKQCSKYGLKGTRLGELLRVIEFLKPFNRSYRLGDVCENFIPSEFVFPKTLIHEHKKENKSVEEDFLCILGKFYPLTRHVGEVVDSLEIMNQEYGGRAKLAMENEGIDWKAVSHAYRACHQLIELATFKTITFPLPQAAFIKRVKAGEISYALVQEELPELMKWAETAVEKSDLPDEPDREFWEDWLLKQYLP